MGNRMSALATSRFCGRAAELSVGAGRAAMMSTVFHARCANPGNYYDEACLTPEELETIGTWQPPADTSFTFGKDTFTLRYKDAVKELEVALTDTAGACSADDPRSITVGHLDMAWRIDLPDGRKVAYVGDIKKTQWTTLDGPESLQLIAYAFAFAALEGCDAFCCGIWQATEGQWHWGEVIDFDSEQAGKLWDEVKHAASNVGGDFATGPHCSGCWSRLRCPAHLLPPETFVGTSLECLAEGAERTHENMLQLLTLKQRAADTLKVIDSELKAFANAHYGIKDGNGKVWRAVICKGRETFDSKRALEVNPELQVYMRQGGSYETYRWMKESK